MDRSGFANNRHPPRTAHVSYIAAMWIRIRTGVIWSLVLALSAHGAAAATMALCRPAHAGALGIAQPHGHGQAASSGPAAGHPHERQGASRGHSHPTQGARGDLHDPADAPPVQAATSASAASLEAPAQTLAQADQHGCSACASCCSAAAFSSETVAVPSPHHGPDVFRAPVPAVERFASGGPDRPPRALVA